jgi:hypothetical protein
MTSAARRASVRHLANRSPTHRAGAGLEEPVAESTAVLLLGACDGAVVMGRAERDLGPFDTVAASLVAYTDTLA